MKENNEHASRIPGRIFALVDRSLGLSLSFPSFHMGHAGHLLFKSAVGLVAHRAGDSLCDIHDLGSMVFASSAHDRSVGPAVLRRGRMVGYHLSLV